MASSRVSFQLICLISCCYFSLQAKKSTLLNSIHIKVDSLEIVHYNPKYFRNASSMPNMNFWQIEVIKSIPNIYAQLRTYDPQNDHTSMKMEKLNICALMSKTFQSNILGTIYRKAFVNSTSLSCPVKEGKYLIKSKDPDFTTLPQFHPIGTYQFKVHLDITPRGKGELLKLKWNYSVENV